MSVAPITVSCMQGDLVHVTATVPVARVQMDLSTADDPWTKDSVNNVYTKSWTAAQFASSDMTVDVDDNLVLTKSVAAPCTNEKVDGINVCTKTGHSLEFKCKYPLGTRTIKNNLNVSGHDANVDAEGVGELKYTLTVADGDVKIGEPVEVTITPANPNLVFAQLNDCNVEYSEDSVSILNFGAGNAGGWEYAANMYLSSWTSYGSNGFDTLGEAQTKCLEVADCGGVIHQNNGFIETSNGKPYQLRKGTEFKPSPSSEESWKKVAATMDTLDPVCEIGANIDTPLGKTDLEFDWKAFKWATATKDAVEKQTISCTIKLSKDSSDLDVGSC